MGEGNFEDYGMRMYNTRLGRFFNVDPLTKEYPELTPYQFASNSPISGVDLDGLEYYYSADGTFLGKYGKSTQLRIATDYEIKENGKLNVSKYVEYNTNSSSTRLGRNEEGNSIVGEKDFNGIRKLSNDDIGRLLAFGNQVFENVNSTLDHAVVLDESIGTSKNGRYGLLDFKFVTYDLFNIDPNALIEINGIVYNAGEAGNFLWGMVLAYQDVSGAALAADIQTRISQGRPDEDFDQKAIKNGDKFGEKLDELFSDNPVKKAADKYSSSGQSEKDVNKIKKDAKDGTKSNPNSKRKDPSKNNASKN